MLRFKSTANHCVVYLITLVSLSLPHLLFAMPALPGDIAVRAFPRGGSLADFATLKFAAQDYTMSRKSTAPTRKRAGASFHLEQLEPRCMFAADGFLPEPRGESFLDGDGLPAISLHDIPPLVNSTWLPMVFAGQNTTISQSQSLQLGAEVLVNRDGGLAVQWSKVSGPGSVNFSNAASVSATVQFSQAGTYELELAATNNGEVASDRLVVTVTAANVVNITQSWLDAQGEGPYYLDQAGKTYVLQTDVTTEGTAFAIIADDIVFDLNGHTITYNNAAPINIPNGSFESGSGTAATGWNFANAPNAERFAGEFLQNQIYAGQRSLHFKPGFSGTKTVTSTGTITLEANTTYSLSAMLNHAGWVKDTGAASFVRLVGQNNANEHEVLWDTRNNRGIQFREAVFTTGNSAETYKVVVGATNPNAVAGFEAFIDDIKIQRTKVYGIATNVAGSRAEDYPDIDRYGSADSVTIKNGTLIQGNDKATNSHGIYAYGTDAEIAHMTITVCGANSNVINGIWSKQSNIHHNTLTSNVKTIQSRDSFHGAMIYRAGGAIHNNTIVGGPHTGILMMGTKNQIYDNEISIRSHYTNAFAITVWNDLGSDIHGNLIELTTEDFSGRGISLNRMHDDVPEELSRIHDNTVRVRELARNQEYHGAVIGGAYGIQLEGAKNVEIFGNTVDAIAHEASAYALRLNNYLNDGRNVRIHDNVFRALMTNTDPIEGVPVTTAIEAFSVKIADMRAASDVRIEDNIFSSNYGWLGETRGTTDVRLLRNTLKVEGDGTGFIPVQGINSGNDPEAHEERANKGLRFVDSVYFNSLARDKFENEPFDNAYNKWFGGVEPHSWLFSSWSTTVLVKDAGGNPLANAAISITDANGLQVFAGNTGANGSVTVVVDAFRLQGAEKSSYGAHTVTAKLNDIEVDLPFTADRAKTLELSLAIAPNTTSHDQRGDEVFWARRGEFTIEAANFLPEARGDLIESLVQSYDEGISELYPTPGIERENSAGGSEWKAGKCKADKSDESELVAGLIDIALAEENLSHAIGEL